MKIALKYRWFQKKTYEYIILDTPPSGLVTDSVITMKFSDINLGGAELSNKSSSEMIGSKEVYEKISEINGNLKTLNAKLEGKNIV